MNILITIAFFASVVWVFAYITATIGLYRGLKSVIKYNFIALQTIQQSYKNTRKYIEDYASIALEQHIPFSESSLHLEQCMNDCRTHTQQIENILIKHTSMWQDIAYAVLPYYTPEEIEMMTIPYEPTHQRS